MTTWTSKGSLAALALTLLGACEGGISTAGRGGSSGLDSPGAAPLKQARMAGGAVRLVPPQGFCIDRPSLSPTFALLARCDVLGAETAANAPNVIITVSISPASANADLPDPAATALAAGLTSVTDQVRTKEETTFRASGPAPAPGLSARHWRGTTLIGEHLLGLALYGPQDGREVGRAGRGLLRTLIRASRTASR